MNLNELKQKSIPHFYAIKIDLFLSRKKRKILRMSLAVFALFSFSFSFDSLPLSFGGADGFFFLFLISFLVLFFLELFYRSMVGEGFSPMLNLDFALSDLIFHTDEIDASRALFESKIGLSILGRLGLPREVSEKFIYENRVPVVASSFEFASNNVSLAQYITLLYDRDKSLQSFLSKSSISREMLISAAGETSKLISKRKKSERFWTKENLGAIPSLGSNPFFEIAYGRKERSQFLEVIPSSELDIYSIKADEDVSIIENFLASGASVAIISENLERVEEKVRALQKKISLGVVSPAVEHKKLFFFDSEKFFGAVLAKDYGSELSKVFSSSGAFEKLIYISDFAGLLLRFREAKIDSSKVIFRPGTALLVCIKNADYKFFVETSKTLSNKFESITIS